MTMEHILEQHGLLIGVVLLVVVVACAVLLGRKANVSVQAFRDEHHERFKGNHNR